MKKNKSHFLLLGFIVLIALLSIIIAAFFMFNRGVWDGNSYQFMSYDKYVTLCPYKKMTIHVNNHKKTDKELAKASTIQRVVTQSKMKKYPSKQVSAEKKRLKHQYRLLSKRYKKSYDEVIAMTGSSKKEFNHQLNANAKAIVKEKMVMYAIAKKENITISSNEYSKYKQKLFKQYGLTDKQFRKSYQMSFEEYAKENALKDTCLENKVAEYLSQLDRK